MKKIGLYIDVSNLYYCIYNNMKSKLNYSKLLEFITPLGDIVIAKAYGAQVKDEAEPFIKRLKELSFETFYKVPVHGKADWDVGISVDIIKDLKDVDMVILATADGDMVPLAKYVLSLDKEIVVIGSNISKELQHNVTKHIEIPRSMVTSLRRKDESSETK